MNSSIEDLVAQTHGQFLLICCELTVFPEIEEDAQLFASGVRSRTRERQIPVLLRVLPEFESRIPGLVSRVSFRVNDASKDKPSYLHFANDGEASPQCRTCASPRRADEIAEQLGRVIAHNLAAIHRPDAVKLRLALDQLPSNFDEGHILPLAILKRAFQKYAAVLALPKTVVRRVTVAIERVEQAATQLSFEFARAA